MWFMRQAGRSLPEYRALRERHSFFELAGTPELCAEVTLQPVRRHGVDAAVIFADIVTPVLGMGIDVRLVEGVGPVVDEPIASAGDVERLRLGEPDANVIEAIRIVRRELDAPRAVIGFCGAPFTVAGYLVEGKPTRDFARTKALMYREPATWHALMEKLTRQFVALRRRAGGRWRGRRPAVRLVGRRALARGLRRIRRAVLRPDPRRGRRPDDPLRHRHDGGLARAARARRRRRDRARLARCRSTRLAVAGPTARCRGTSIPRRCSAPGSASSASALDVLARSRAAAAGTSSTSATACCRDTDSRTPRRARHAS